MLWSSLVWFACGGPSDPDVAVPVPTPTRLEAFRAELMARGLTIQEGKAAELDPVDCCAWETCYLFNPDNRYLGWWLPPGPGQTADDPILDADGLALAWRLRADEAVVAVGRTPPAAPYFSYRSYLHDRWFPDTQARDWLFFNLGDSLNQFVIDTSGDSPFDAEFLLTTTAHPTTEARIAEAALAAGYPAEMLNTDVVFGDDLVLGLHETADTFRMQNRMALFDDPVAGEAYLADPPITVWRITPATPLPPARLEPVELRTRGTGQGEEAWADALDALDVSIRETHAGYVAHDLPVVNTSTDEECPPGCNRDTYFGVTVHWLLPLWADAFIEVYGVNHERTGKSVYSNFSVVGVDHLSAFGAVNSRAMPGSASTYLPDHPQADDLYAWTLSRDCAGDPTCIEVLDECPGFGGLEEGSIAFRAYTEAETATGPLLSEILVDRAILFTRPLVP